jgi:glycosyltransferase involved in cell wall biosynthesis
MTAPGSLPQKKRIAIVGPTHPYGGGVAQHTSKLASELSKEAIFSVSIESWKAQYPRAIHRSQAFVGTESPEVPFAGDIWRNLSWYSPLSWFQTGLKLRRATILFLTVVSPFHVVPYFFICLPLGKSTQKIALIHNALPHERTPLDKFLIRILRVLIDGAIVHDAESASIIQGLGRRVLPLRNVALPSPWEPPRASEALSTADSSKSRGRLRVLFFGNVREYKGLGILLEALSQCPHAELLVAGTFWGNRQKYENRIRERDLAGRVALKDSYVAVEEFELLFGNSDVLVMPYRSGTASIVPRLAMSYGIPVVASNVGSIADAIIPGHNGLVLENLNPDNLGNALRLLGLDRELLRKMKANAASTAAPQDWEDYVRACLELAGAGGPASSI